jgi:hypothetical protein
LANNSGVVLIDCWACDTHRFFFARDLAARFSRRAGPVKSLSFKCTKCGRYARRQTLYTPLDPMAFR